ncbi:type II secretion system F family protein [archaeon]|nr:type II secretion system F family protein [archaeon]
MHTQKVEKELPLALRTLSTELAINMPFEQSLESLSEGHGELSKDFQKITQRINAGYTVRESLLAWTQDTPSKQVKRVALQLISNYENKEDPLALRKLSEELLSQQKTKMREYTSQLAVYSLLFIAVSAIFPALFQAYVIIGSSFMSQTVTPEQALLIPIIGFPLADIAILAIIKKRKPL